MQQYIDYNSTRIEYELIRRNRKSVGITISPDKGVEVIAPNSVSKKEIDDIVREKASWILAKLSIVSELNSKRVSRHLVSGEKLLYLGKEYVLNVVKTVDVKSFFTRFDNDIFTVSLPFSPSDENYYIAVRHSLVGLYRQLAMVYISERIKFYSEKLNVKPSKLLIKEQKTRWGSCTSSNAININWKVIMAPVDVIDYLVVHELSHIRVRNHSQHFWALVGSILPNYKELRSWLKTNGRALEI